MRRFFVLLLVGLPLAAQSKQERGKKVVDDALEALGKPDEVRGLFVGFQRYLYQTTGRA